VKATQLPQIETVFGSLAQAVLASEGEWRAANVLKPKQLERLFAEDVEQKTTEALAWCEEAGQSIICLADDHYPTLLRDISDAPILLYVRGRVDLLNDPQIAIVGSRHASKQGRLTAIDFAQHLATMGLTITSGLAAGIDKAAHEGALKAAHKLAGDRQATTVAVVATGLDRVYPAANRELAREIAEVGAIVSEYPLGTQPMAHFFPQRNRIISGLSVGTLVVEAALKSGSLITAKLALEQGREVFAVPGSINNPQAKGCHQLIRNGAKLVESGQDILEELTGILQLSLQLASDNANTQSVGQAEKNAEASEFKILQWVEYEPIGIDELVVLSKMPVSQIQTELLMLELNGTVEAMSAGRWRRL